MKYKNYFMDKDQLKTETKLDIGYIQYLEWSKPIIKCENHYSTKKWAIF